MSIVSVRDVVVVFNCVFFLQHQTEIDLKAFQFGKKIVRWTLDESYQHYYIMKYVRSYSRYFHDDAFAIIKIFIYNKQQQPTFFFRQNVEWFSKKIPVKHFLIKANSKELLRWKFFFCDKYFFAWFMWCR